MLAIALVFFREVLEAALVIGILAAATAGVAGRSRWLAGGVCVGLAGAVLVALSAEALASAAEGMGQELFNASVLFAAVLMLSWHTVWMARHGRELSTSLGKVGTDVAAGVRGLSALGVVVALAVLREGAEIVLILQGLLASGSASSTGMLGGSALGLLVGAGAGYGIYRGLKLIPTRWLFNATSCLIALLAAGMASHAMAFLVQSGHVGVLTETAWNTSTFIADQSATGQVLAALVGYTATPMWIQVAAYAGTVAALLALAALPAGAKPAARPAALGHALKAGAAGLVLLMAHAPTAEAGFKVYSPHVEQGEWEAEFRGNRSLDGNASKEDGRSFLYELAYSPTAYWHTAVFLETEGSPGAPNVLSEFAWENIFQLTEPGQYWLDVGAYLEYGKGLEHGDDHKLEWKLLFEKDFGRFVTIVNPIFEKSLTEDDGVEFGYAWGTYYRLDPRFEPGFEAFGEIGELTDAKPVAAQEHFIGPVVRGEFPLGGTRKLEYNLGYLFGLTDDTPNGEAKFELAYEWRF